MVALLAVKDVSDRMGGCNTAAMYAAPHRHWLSKVIHGLKVSDRMVGAGEGCRV